MSELLGVTIEDLVATAKERSARIPSEIGAFVALEVCEALIDGPAAVRPADVRVADDGTVSVFAPPHSAMTDEAARAVVALLRTLSGAAGSGVPRALASLIEEGPSSGHWDLASLRDDLEASLVPLNRGAARRVLSRMLREIRRPRSSRPPPRRAPDLDSELDALLDAPASAPVETPSPDALDAELDATISELESPSVHAPIAAREREARDDVPREEPARAVPVDAPRASARAPSAARASRAKDARSAVAPDDATLRDEHVDTTPRRASSDAPTDPAPAAPSRRASSLDELAALDGELDRPKRGALGWIFAFIAILVATAAALAVMRPDLVDALLGRPPASAPDLGPTAEERAEAERARRGRFGTLSVSVGAPRAQVLMFAGRGPALATDLPVGLAHELVAIVDGQRPARSVVPAGAAWPEADGRPRYELAMQIGGEPMRELALGPSLLPRELGQSTGALGDVRVITNPPGAKVYLLIGFAPSVTVENVRTEEAIELLVVPEAGAIERVVVGPSDWEAQPDGTKRAAISVAAE